MTRPTLGDQATSEALGGALSPSQIRRRIAGGLGPPMDANPLEYWRTVVQMAGQGHPLDVEAVRLADLGYATPKLRRVIAEPDAARSEAVFAPLMARLAGAASAVVRAGTPSQAAGLPEGAEVEATVMVEATLADLEDALTDGANDPAFVDARELARQVALDIGGPAEPGRGEEPYADEFAALMGHFADAERRRQAWAEEANDAELVTAVRGIAALWWGGVASGLGVGAEDAWRTIAFMAPIAAVLAELVAEVRSQITPGSQLLNSPPPGTQTDP